jgi:radical SAM superfamily enzyme YgiQ (UPF0313 family)
MNYEGFIIRPPSEADSIILQVTRGCSHNHCSFCGAYKDVDFRIKDDFTIDQDIEFASRHCLKQKRVFLADGDVLILPMHKLLNLFNKIRVRLPQVTRISLYGNGKAIRNKSLSDLITLKKLGLSRIYLGVESGDDHVLAAINKGETSETLAAAGQKVKKAGIFLSTSVILGLGGVKNSRQHATATASLLNRINPNQIAALTLMVLDNTPLAEQVDDTTFELPDALGFLTELRILVEKLTVDRIQFMANHRSNYLPISGRLARDKGRILDEIDQALLGYTDLVPDRLRAL